MKDAIFRQASINLVEAEPINGWVKQHLVEELMTLPPAQPEIIYCKDCYWAREINGVGYYRCDHKCGLQGYIFGDDYCSFSEVVDE